MSTAEQARAYRFVHGLGDCANFAHIVAAYKARGIDLGLSVTADKECLFRAAQAEIVPKDAAKPHEFGHPAAVPTKKHDWPNPNTYEKAQPGQAWRVNKTGHNIGKLPLPPFGLEGSDAWREVCGVELSLREQYDVEICRRIDELLADLPRPIVLVHTNGNTGQDAKSWKGKAALPLMHAILDATDGGSLVQLDWDNRVERIASRRVRHIQDDGFLCYPCDVVATAYLIDQADLLVGVDSGPLHLARFTDTPAIGLWKTHHPCFYALPRAKTLHLVGNKHKEWDVWTRCEFNTIMSAQEEVQPTDLESAVRGLLSGKSPAEVQFAHFLAKTRSQNAAITNYIDRNLSFGMVAEHLRQHPGAVMVETGCIRAAEDWGGAGYSTYLFGRLFQTLGSGHLYSVDLTRRNVEFARRACSEFSDFVTVHEEHSHRWLADLDGPAEIDVFYSDSLDTDSQGHAGCCLEECRLALPKLAADGLILIDDTVHQKGQWRGKGATAVPWLLEQGWKIKHAGYQALLGR